MPLLKITWRESPLWYRCFGVFALSNFALFWICAMLLGGIGRNRKIFDRQFSWKGPAGVTEIWVSASYNGRLHAIVTLVVLIGTVVLGYLFVRPRRWGRAG